MFQQIIVSIDRKETLIIKYIKEYMLYEKIEYELSVDRLRAIFKVNIHSCVVGNLVADVLLFFYKYKVLSKELKKCAMKDICYYAYVGALLSIDYQQEKTQLIQQIELLGNTISIDGFYNFCSSQVKENWYSLSQLAFKLYNQCKNEEDAFELTSFILGVDGEGEEESIIVIDNNASIKLLKNKQPIPIIHLFDKETANIIVTLLSQRPTNIIVVNPAKIEPDIMRTIHYLGE